MPLSVTKRRLSTLYSTQGTSNMSFAGFEPTISHLKVGCAYHQATQPTTQDTCAYIIYIVNEVDLQVDVGYTLGLQLCRQKYFYFLFYYTKSNLGS